MSMQDAGGKRWNICNIKTKNWEKVGQLLDRGTAVGQTLNE